MQLDDAPESTNVEDSRGMGTKFAIGGVGGIVLLVLGLIFGKDLVGDLLEPGTNAPVNHPARDEKTLVFTKKVLGTTEAVWKDEFRKMGKTYAPPHLNLFSDKVQTGCGLASAGVGPFYCPADKTVYLDPTFFDELERKLGATDTALALWSDLAACKNLFRAKALEELAKHHEHKSKDYGLALEMTRKALALENSAALRKREERLAKKVSRLT